MGDVRPKAGMKSSSQTGRDERGHTSSELRARVLAWERERASLSGHYASLRAWGKLLSSAQLAAPSTGDGASDRTGAQRTRHGP